MAMISECWTRRSIMAATTCRRRRLLPRGEGFVKCDDDAGSFVAGRDELEE